MRHQYRGQMSCVMQGCDTSHARLAGILSVVLNPELLG